MAARFHPTGLTVVSPNPVYIQGDYNTGRDCAGSPNPPSNNATSDPTQPQVSRSTPGAPCSVLADAVTILSNSWDDSNGISSGDPLAALPLTRPSTRRSSLVSFRRRPASQRRRRCSYSGGAENFPRFLEDWDNKSLHLLRVDGGTLQEPASRSVNGRMAATFTVRRTGNGILTTISRRHRPQAR